MDFDISGVWGTFGHDPVRTKLPNFGPVPVAPITIDGNNSITMKGVRILQDETTKKRIIQIDMEVIERKREELSDMLDMIIAESRKNDEMIPWDKAKAMLRKSDRL